MRIWPAVICAAIFASALQATDNSAETQNRVQIAAATFEDTIVVDCQLPGRLQQLGGMRTYLTPGVLTRLPAIDCRTRGGEYTIGDLASGTLSLKRWLPLADKDNVEAQYYVARIYANGMDNVPVDYAQAAKWYQRAAQRKYAPAMRELAYLYEQGFGVQKDPVAGINLERSASGLGDELVYASALTANKEEAAAQIAALTGQLNAASANVQDLQSQLAQADDKLQQNTAQFAQDQTRLRELRSKLEQAKAQTGQDPTRVRQLQDQLAAAEADLKVKQDSIGTLSTGLQVQQAQLTAQLAKSQATNSQLNDMLTASKSESEALRTRLAQSEQRALQSQQELSALRADFLRQTGELSARSAQLQQLRQHGTDGLQSVLDARQAEIERQQQLVTSLQSQLSATRQQAGAVGATSEAALAALRVQYGQQQQELQTQKAEFAKLQSQSKEDRSALLTQLTAQLATKSAALEDSQKRLASLQLEATQLRDAYNKERDQQARDVATAGSAQQQDKDALRVAQGQLAQQREALQQLEMQSAAQQLKLVQERETLAQQLSNGTQGSQQKIAALEADVRDRDKQILEARGRISTLEKQGTVAKATTVASDVSYRMPQAPGTSNANPYALLQLVRGLGPANYHALVIGNSKYRSMQPLKTPANDARDVADLLTGRYGFDVKLLIDATRKDIANAMREYARTLTDSDRLLIYYAGHGGTKIYPPERAFWLGVDADPDLPESWISAQVVSDDIAQIHARHILLVADSCFSSVITHATSTIVAPSNDERSVSIKWTRAARMVLTSGQDEPVVDGSSADQTHSLFAGQFLTILRQNDILLSGEGLAHELSSRMSQYAERVGLKQTPTYSNLQDQQHMYGDFFFVPVAATVQVASIAH